MRSAEAARRPSTSAGVDGEERPELSVVIPFYNEEQCAAFVLDEVRATLAPLGATYEVLAVDDGSKDRTPAALAAFARDDPRFRVLRWEANRGQAAALYWGLRSARAPIVVTMDGDGQNDPAEIPALLGELDEADMVVGIRAARRDSWLRRRMSRLANAVRGRLLRDHMRDSGCALKAFRREVVESFIPIRTLYSFMPALAVAAGFRVAQREVRHRPRHGGTSSYGLWKFLWRPLLDLLGVWWFTRRSFAWVPAAQNDQRTPNEGRKLPQLTGSAKTTGSPRLSSSKRNPSKPRALSRA
jgi:glycosyltransferase involved in cell wall biosynthesis